MRHLHVIPLVRRNQWKYLALPRQGCYPLPLLPVLQQLLLRRYKQKEGLKIISLRLLVLICPPIKPEGVAWGSMPSAYRKHLQLRLYRIFLSQRTYLRSWSQRKENHLTKPELHRRFYVQTAPIYLVRTG